MIVQPVLSATRCSRSDSRAHSAWSFSFTMDAALLTGPITQSTLPSHAARSHASPASVSTLRLGRWMMSTAAGGTMAPYLAAMSATRPWRRTRLPSYSMNTVGPRFVMS